jgi:hypothetical protein
MKCRRQRLGGLKFKIIPDKTLVRPHLNKQVSHAFILSYTGGIAGRIMDGANRDQKRKKNMA